MFPDMFEVFNQDKEERPSGTETPSHASSCLGNVFCLSVGGSILVGEKPDVSAIAKFSECLNALLKEGYAFVVVVGGGKVCRNYAAAAKSLGANNFFLDEIGIAVTRINAALLTQSIENAYTVVLKEIRKAREILQLGKTPVYGGLMPGFTTDAVAALLAESLHGTFVNLSNVDGVYSSDPNQNPNAKFYPELSYDRLISIIKLQESKPSQNVIIDLPASLVLKRSQIKSFFLDGNDLPNFEACIRGQEFRGTVVSSETQAEEETGKISRETEDYIAEKPARRTTRKRKAKIEAYEDDEEEIDPDDIDL